MNKSSEKKNSEPKTLATLDAVFSACYRLAATGVTPTYEILCEEFNASTKTIKPLIQAWKESLVSIGEWEVPEATQKILDSNQAVLWGALCKLAQSKVVCETHDLNQKLKEAKNKLEAYEKTNTNSLEENSELRNKFEEVANENISLASQLHEASTKISHLEDSIRSLESENLKLKSVNETLHAKEIEIATLNGKIEGLIAALGDRK